MALQLYLLGQFKMRAGDRPVDLPSRPAQSLLAFLALNAGINQRREKLAGILWPEATDSNARAYLRQALWRIRKALADASLDSDEYLNISDVNIALSRHSDYWLDAAQFIDVGQNASVEEMLAAIDLYKGELLPGFYDEWIQIERDRFQATYHRRMNTLLNALLAEGRWHDVVKWGEEWIRLGYSPEPAFRALMRAYAGMADQSMINVTFRRTVETLDRELGVEPSLETQDLYEQLQQEQSSQTTSNPLRAQELPELSLSFLNSYAEQQHEEPVFVARQRELSRLDDFLKLAIEGHGKTIFVTGETGSGKTAIIKEFSRRAQNSYDDLIVAAGNSDAHTGIGDPYLPFREILDLLTGDVEAQWSVGTVTGDHACRLWQTMPLACKALVEHGPDLIDTFIPGAALYARAAAAVPAGTGWLDRLNNIVERNATIPAFRNPHQSDLFEQYTRVLMDLARRAPLVLAIDDLQWADLGSISLLFHLGRHLAGHRILIVGSYRSEEVAIGRDGQRHPLASVISELQRMFADIEVDLEQAERREFIDAVLDSEPNNLGTAFRKMLKRQTRGHPLFTIELLRGLQERGDLQRDSKGRWSESAALDWEQLPARVEAVVAERIGRLSPALRAVLRVASVEGEVFTAEVVAQVRGLEESALLEELSGALDRNHRLVRAHSITRKNDRLLSTYRFRHIQIQKYLYGSLDEVERVHLHEQIGTVLEKLHHDYETRSAIALQLARHFEEAKITDKAVDYQIQAGERALQLSAYQEARAHLSKGLALLQTLPASQAHASRELRLQLALGKAWMSLGSPAVEMELAFARARDLCKQLGKTSQLCSAIGGLAILNFIRADYQRARSYAEEALDLAQQTDDPLLILVGHWYLGFVLTSLGEFVRARKHLGEVLSRYDASKHHRALVLLRGVDPGLSAMAYDAYCLWCLGYPEQALKLRQNAIDLAREIGHPFTLADVLCFAGCMIDSHRREAASLLKHAEQLNHLAKAKSLPGWLKMATWFRGESFAMMGQVDKGLSFMTGSIKAKIDAQELISLAGIYCRFAEVLLENGQLEAAQNLLLESFKFMEEKKECYLAAEFYRVRAELSLAQNDTAGAQVNYTKAITIAQEQQAKSWELRAAIGLARLRRKQEKSEEIRSILAPIYGWFTEGFDTPDLVEARTLLEEVY